MEASRRSVLKLFGVSAVVAAAPAAIAATIEPDKVFQDPFVIVGNVPENTLYNWKRIFIDSELPDMDHLAKMVASGWKPVPRSRHPDMGSEQGYWIERGGLVLMEKPVG